MPNGPEATAALSRAFFQLTDYPVEDRAKVPSEELDVGGGRTLHVPKSLKGVAVFSFKRLCGEPRGAADYLAIARRYHTVIIVGIPVMTREMRNEAARFVTLIDALYEHKVKLLAAADAEPEGLYPVGRRQLRVPADRQPARGNAQRRISCGGSRHRNLTGRARTVASRNSSRGRFQPCAICSPPLALPHSLCHSCRPPRPPQLTPGAARCDACDVRACRSTRRPSSAATMSRRWRNMSPTSSRRPASRPSRRPRHALSHGQRDDGRRRHCRADRPLARRGQADRPSRSC